MNARIHKLVGKQTSDIRARLESDGVRIVDGEGRMVGPFSVEVAGEQIESDVTLLALGARPRVLPTAMPDGERIFTWTQLYELTELPEHLVVVGSGVTGAEFAGAYQLLGSDVTLISSSTSVLGKHDPEAAQFIHEVFDARGMTMVTVSVLLGLYRLPPRGGRLALTSIECDAVLSLTNRLTIRLVMRIAVLLMMYSDC